MIERITRTEIPPVLDYLEAQLPAEGFLFGEPGIAEQRAALLAAGAPVTAETLGSLVPRKGVPRTP